ncbi:MAG TPA: cupredoxin domain-containing protein [Gaiellaceae bacterium]|nr:cupredoxin domain-containing protein [Gaiellaceae bacterium]
MHSSRSAARLASALAVAVAALALAGAALAAPAHRTGTTVKVTATEFKFVLSPSTAKAGSITFTIVNKGKLAHDFAIAGKKSALIQPGKTGKLTVTLRAGSYPYKCTVPGHAAAGMKGTFTVK